MAKGKGWLQARKIPTRSSASPGSGDLSRHAESARSEIPAPVFYPSGRLSDWLGPTLAPGFFRLCPDRTACLSIPGRLP